MARHRSTLRPILLLILVLACGAATEGSRAAARENPMLHVAAGLQLSAATHLPLWLGEFGEGTLEGQRSRVELMQANDNGWAVWPWKRIDLHNGHPVIGTIQVPEAWHAVAGYLVGAWLARQPSRPNMERAMASMLKAIRELHRG